MTTKNELVTVIVPVYNVQEYVDECLRGITDQTYADLEILAVDDGSTDGSAAKLAQWAARDSRIRVIRKANGGLSDARNAGLAEAHGTCVAFIDSDDTVDARMIKELLKALHSSGAEIAVADMEYHYPDGSNKFASGGAFRCTSVKQDPQLMLINNSACNKLYRMRLFQNLRFPAGKYYEDLALIPILLYEAAGVVKVNEPFYYYRQRGGSIAHTASRQIFDIYDAIDGVIAYVKEHGNEPQVLEQLYHLYVIHGLDLTTLRIRDFDDRGIRAQYLRENMERLRKSYPDYEKDSSFQTAGFRKKLIWDLLKNRQEKLVLRLYD